MLKLLPVFEEALSTLNINFYLSRSDLLDLILEHHSRSLLFLLVKNLTTSSYILCIVWYKYKNGYLV